MVLELVSFLGTSVGGKIFGVFGDWLSDRRQEKRERRVFKHEAKLASQGALKDYLTSVFSTDANGKYSPFAWTIAFCIGLLCVTYCIATLSCFLINPTDIIYSKDPTAGTQVREIFFGAIRWDATNNRVLAMSKLGCGFLMSYPVVFILSAVLKLDTPKSR